MPELPFGRSLQRHDIAEELNVDLNTATLFLRLFGVRMGGWHVISEKEFRLLQAEGTVAEFVSRMERKPQTRKKDTPK